MAEKCMKGQVSMELLVTLGIVIAFTIPVIFLLLSVSSAGYEKAAKDQADASARSLADGINTVYAQGAGAKRILLLNAPTNTKEIDISNNEVTVTIKTSTGDYDAVAPVFATVTNTQPIRQKAGLFQLNITNSGGQVVIVG